VIQSLTSEVRLQLIRHHTECLTGTCWPLEPANMEHAASIQPTCVLVATSMTQFGNMPCTSSEAVEWCIAHATPTKVLLAAGGSRRSASLLKGAR
jgi:hypothetical protein